MAIVKRLIKGSKLTWSELDGNFTHFEEKVANLEKRRTIKQISNTSQYTFISADFTDFILDFTANEGQTINTILNTGVAPIGGMIQIVSSGNNFLVPTAGSGIIFKTPLETILKTTGGNSWLSIIPFGTTNTFGVNGNLESTATSGEGTTFTNITENQYGTHPAFTDQATLNAYLLTNLGGTVEPSPTYTIVLSSPTAGQVFTEGDIVTVSATVTTT